MNLLKYDTSHEPIDLLQSLSVSQFNDVLQSHDFALEMINCVFGFPSVYSSAKLYHIISCLCDILYFYFTLVFYFKGDISDMFRARHDEYRHVQENAN